jgi:sodium/proline symporter
MTIAFAGYFLLVMAIGITAWLKTRNLSDYILGGRRLGPGAAALSAGASDMSGWLLLGLPGYAYLAGLEALWLALALLLGSYLNWRLVAPRLRSSSASHADALTIPEYFYRVVPDSGRLLRLCCGAMILVFYLIYTASGFVAGAKLFEAVYGFDYHIALTIGALAIVGYTFFGGFLAVVWTDVAQGLLMLAALLWVPLMVFSALPAGGAVAIASVETLVPLAVGGGIDGIALVSSLAWGLGYFGQPHILARFMAIRDVSEIPRARRIAVLWTGLCLSGAIAAGLGGAAIINPPLADAETVFMTLVNTLFHPLIAGILLAAILAAIMSTADSQLLVASSVLSGDLCSAMPGIELNAAQQLWLGRLAVLVLALVALWLAWDPGAAVLDLVGYAWAGFGASVGPALLVSLYVPRVRGSTLLAGMVVGGITVILWRQGDGGWFELYEMVPGIMASLLAMFLAERLARLLPVLKDVK